MVGGVSCVGGDFSQTDPRKILVASPSTLQAPRPVGQCKLLPLYYITALTLPVEYAPLNYRS